MTVIYIFLGILLLSVLFILVWSLCRISAIRDEREAREFPEYVDPSYVPDKDSTMETGEQQQ
ncbi:hypothetical protein [Bifidobacterium sp. SO1]|uniref:hypothetical protein n=1 Tax=Bifidobacterium sp. SO1 TaxID=2809029 RepID=UPI001BDC3BAF|nr:hypothetical protein [Bifidobacterium sp. SO1]MBT1162157.1 hypothetical protein [Bifidobacterium sp. SO1]